MKYRIAILAVLCATGAWASVTPHAGPGDPHVQAVEYDPEQVVEIRVAPGFAVTIEFSPDERIENVALGNSAAWQATPNKRADHLFIKPIQGGTATNLTIITDARRYNFDLVPAYSPEPDLPYSVRFTYPQAVPGAERLLAEAPVTYRFSGKRALLPTAITDDGKFTSIIWAADTPLPAIYSVDDQGQEMLVNGSVRDGAYVIEEVARRFVFRLGRDKATATRLMAKQQR